MLYFILAIVLIFIIKFIYDSYLTNNTERDWQDFKNRHPAEAAVIDNSKGFDMRTTADIRFDGYYLAKHVVKTREGQDICLYHVLVFSSHGYAYLIQNQLYEDFNNFLQEDFQEIKEIISSFTEDDLDNDVSKYKVIDGIIYMEFNYYSYKENSDGLEKSSVINILRWEGVIIRNGLILSSGDSFLGEGNYKYHDIRFDFIKK